MKKAALYVRVSTQEQKKHGLSVYSQIQALKDFCDENGYFIADIYNDAGISARKRYTRRPELLRLMNDCKNGKIDIILFTKLDRWFRSVADYYEVQTVLDAAKVPWRAIWEDYETETSSGVFKVNIMLSVAQSEADRTSERIKAVNEYKIAGGAFVGSAPTGYKMQKADLVIDEEKRAAVTAFWNNYLATLSVSGSVNVMREYGLTIGHDTAIRMLKNPAYVGRTRQGYKCEPYLTEEQWEIVQRSVEARKTHRNIKENRSYYFTGGILRCGVCGGYMTGSVRKIGKYKYEFYRCTKARNQTCENNTTISELKVEQFLISNLSDLIGEHNKAAEAIQKQPIVANFELKRLTQKLERIGERYEEGEIDRQTYVKKRDEVKLQIDDLQKSYIQPVKKELPANWSEVYRQLDRDHRRAFWYQIIKRIEYKKDEPLKVYF